VQIGREESDPQILQIPADSGKENNRREDTNLFDEEQRRNTLRWPTRSNEPEASTTGLGYRRSLPG